ncbi:MAG: Gfo/Idh/MocA family protein [Bacillota bacterium]|jgi:UDP-N-acetyl-2-amino-2-deoxyglucuronate dehydrogenase
MERVGFALVGCGSIAVKHIDAIRQVPGAQLIAIYDTNPNQAKYFSERFNLPYAETFSQLLKRDDLQVIDICAPSAFHAELAKASARARKHVLVEKPMALTLEDADQMIEASEKAGVYLSVILQNRYKPVIAALKKVVDDGDFGKLTHGTAIVRWNRNWGYYQGNPWRGKTSLGGGVLINQAIHNIDLLQWLMGEAESVFAFTANRLINLDAEDVAVGVIQFKSGALGTVEAASTIYPRNLEESINIFGEKGTVIIGGTRSDRVLVCNFAEGGQEILKRSSEEPKGHIPVIEDMVRCIREGTRPAVDGVAGRKSLQIVLAFHESARTGKVIKIS